MVWSMMDDFPSGSSDGDSSTTMPAVAVHKGCFKKKKTEMKGCTEKGDEQKKFKI